MATRKSKTASEAEPKWERTPREVEAVRKVITGRMEGVPRLKIAKSESGCRYVTEHIDDLAGKALIMEAIGTTDLDFFAGFLGQLATAGGGEPNEQQLNFMLSVVKGIKPRDQMEAMLAAQMAANHSATMKYFRYFADAECVEHRDSAERILNKLMRIFVTQLEALKHYRMGVEQTVTVQQVNVSEGGQAIVGNITQGQKDAAPNPPQPLALAHDDTLPMEIIESKEAASVVAPRDANKK
jgi:hypothetical protein